MAMKFFPQKPPQGKKRRPLAGPILLIVLVLAFLATMSKQPVDQEITAQQDEVEPQLPPE
ncbi:hypothetical protein [Paracoccus sp. (in: a-proteobacteria)]|uniref:hypothetical protein n=1 Tax=Paracoccus sp. TaxID=267 RepID=UPI00289A71EF|nr:hypothetical protein [Paracoccus sp. (in: a-proteobacteria)]